VRDSRTSRKIEGMGGTGRVRGKRRRKRGRMGGEEGIERLVLFYNNTPYYYRDSL